MSSPTAVSESSRSAATSRARRVLGAGHDLGDFGAGPGLVVGGLRQRVAGRLLGGGAEGLELRAAVAGEIELGAQRVALLEHRAQRLHLLEQLGAGVFAGVFAGGLHRRVAGGVELVEVAGVGRAQGVELAGVALVHAV